MWLFHWWEIGHEGWKNGMSKFISSIGDPNPPQVEPDCGDADRNLDEPSRQQPSDEQGATC